MTNFEYNRDIPFANNNPSTDQPNMLINTNNIDSLIAVDHVSFRLPDGGFHTVIHQKPFSDTTTNPPKNNPASLPGASGGNGEIITVQMNPVTGVGGNADEVLFFQSGGGRWTQLTNVITGAGNQAQAATNGYCPLPGGIIMQWGRVSSTGNSGNVNFVTDGGIAFLNNCFSVTICPKYTSSLGTVSQRTTYTIDTTTLSVTGFDWLQFPSGGFTYTGFFWIAIGN